MTEPACKHISYRETGYFSRLMLDYLEEKTELKKLYNRFPSLDNFKAQIEEKQSFPKEKREVLSAVLSQQYANLEGARAQEFPLRYRRSLEQRPPPCGARLGTAGNRAH